MSGLNILGGIGQGLMAGTKFMAQQQAQDRSHQLQQGRLAILEEDQAYLHQQRQEEADEKQRLGMINKINDEERMLYQEETGKQELGRFDLAEIQMRAANKAIQAGFMKSPELEKAYETQQRMQQSGIADLYFKTAMDDDWDGFNAGFSKMFKGSTARAEGDNIVITTPDGKESPISRVGFESLLNIDLSARGQEAAAKGVRAQAELGKIHADTQQSLAQAGKYRADARATAAGRHGEPTPMMKNLKFMVDEKIASSTAEAFAMYNTAKGRSPEDAIAALVVQLKENRQNLGKSDDELVEMAANAYAAIQRYGQSARAPAAGGGLASLDRNQKDAGQFVAGRKYRDEKGNEAIYQADGTWKEVRKR